MSERMYEFWSQTDNGRDFCIAITHTGEERDAVWDSLRRARAYVEERTHSPNRYRGKFVRSWSEEEGEMGGDQTVTGSVSQS